MSSYKPITKYNNNKLEIYNIIDYNININKNDEWSYVIDKYLNFNNINPLDVKELYIENCNKYIYIPKYLINLKKLSLICCYNIKEIPNTLINLEYINLYLVDKFNGYISKNFKNLKEIYLNCIKNKVIISKDLINLEVLNLENVNIKKIPNTLINLKKLKLNFCKNIKEIPKTYINLENIIYSNLNLFLPLTLIKLKYIEIQCPNDYNKKIKQFNIQYTYINLKSLKIICGYHKNILNLNIPKTLTNLEYLYLEDLNIKNLPNYLINLKSLSLYNCKKIISISNNYINLEGLLLQNCKKLKFIPNSYINLKFLTINNCNIKIPKYFINLTELNYFNDNYKVITKIKKIKIDINCIIPSTLTKLKKLELSSSKIKDISFLTNNTNLKYLKILRCYHLKFIPNLYFLKYLYIDYNDDIKEIPETLINLKYLYLRSCLKIKYLPSLINLKKIDIYNCHNICYLPDNLINLNYLNLNYLDNFKYIPDTFNNLKYLHLKDLKNLNSIPNFFSKLIVDDNNKIISYPNNFMNLNKLIIEECNLNDNEHYFNVLLNSKYCVKIINSLIDNIKFDKIIFYNKNNLIYSNNKSIFDKYFSINYIPNTNFKILFLNNIF